MGPHWVGVNFLAHLLLADPTPESMIGNLLPDFARPTDDPTMHPAVRDGVRRHRRVDAFTNTHPAFARSRARLRPRHGLFAPVLVDIFYDHVLARQWNEHHALPLGRFAQDAYRAMLSRADLMPPTMYRAIAAMAREDWLTAYAEPAGVEVILGQFSRRLTRRLGRRVQLAPAARDLPMLLPRLTDDLAWLWPELCVYALPARAGAGFTPTRQDTAAPAPA